MRIRLVCSITLCLYQAILSCPAATSGPAPELQEVYDLVRSRLPGATDEELNRAAVRAFVSALHPKVMLLDGKAAQSAPAGSLVLRSNVFDEIIGYIRVGTISPGLSSQVRQSYQKLNSGTRLKGIVLDLRYSGGEDYAAAAEVVGLFLKKVLPVLNPGSGMINSQPTSDAISIPVAALINKQTSGAAEALAAALRQTGAGLLLGGTTAGHAMVARDFSLKNGDKLRVAVGKIELGDGTSLSSEGVKPDILVNVADAEAHAYYADAFYLAAQTNAAGVVTGTNLLRRPRMNEADLVRERRDGPVSDSEPGRPRRFEPERPSVSDPVLARALDLLKGLAVVRHTPS